LERPVTGHAYLDAVLSPPGSVLAIAHRGGAKHPDLRGLENTVRAFRHAYDLGYRYLETDVHLTADGTLLAFHDDILDRVTDRTGPIGRAAEHVLASARIGGSEPIPALADLLEEFPDCRVNIDLKSPGAGGSLAALLDATGAHERVAVGAFSRARIREFRRRTGDRVATSASPAEVMAFVLAPTGRIARAVTGAAVAALQVPYRRGTIPVVTASLVRRAHAAGAHVHVWTVDHPADMNHLIDLGVDGIFTDRTDVLKDVLTARGLWRDPS
jgi:glycerophosphoryl diester phosphodiesterase